MQDVCVNICLLYTSIIPFEQRFRIISSLKCVTKAVKQVKLTEVAQLQREDIDIVTIGAVSYTHLQQSLLVELNVAGIEPQNLIKTKIRLFVLTE